MKKTKKVMPPAKKKDVISIADSKSTEADPLDPFKAPPSYQKLND